MHGLRLMLWGFFMKVVVADRLGLYVNAVYGNVPNHNGTTLLLATILFSFQIYCDFAGYSYIAIGAARVMGFRLMTNFNRPLFRQFGSYLLEALAYIAFHLVRDYVYIPLVETGFRKHATSLTCFGIYAQRPLHGANWTFVIWGSLNGIYLIIESIFHHKKKEQAPFVIRARKLGGVAFTFILISFSWIFFQGYIIG